MLILDANCQLEVGGQPLTAQQRIAEVTGLQSACRASTVSWVSIFFAVCFSFPQDASAEYVEADHLAGAIVRLAAGVDR
tara:strand:- start:535 stop:771 length:237 start_codon:yes stop_codon:yes gene_type:complete